MRLTFVGCGDAFGSGGRLNTCFHVETEDTKFLIDCGASSLIAMKARDIDRNAIDSIVITHFHGDHFGGIPYFILDAQFFSKRTTPLIIAGPEGLQDWFHRVMEATFPGSSATKRKFDLELRELPVGGPVAFPSFELTSARVRHGNPEGPFYAYRIDVDGKVLAYTGDTEWTDSLIAIGNRADLLIAEAYFYDKRVPLHLDLMTLEAKLPLMKPKRLILTHMNDDMLRRAPGLAYECAEDGKVVHI